MTKYVLNPFTGQFDNVGEGGVSGSGTQNYLPQWTGSTTLGDSSIYIDTYGKIGIGTTTPQAELDVEGSIYSSVDASIGGIVYVGQGVGIGTLTPSASLHVYGTGGNIALFGNSNSVLSSTHQVEIVGTGTLTPLVIEGGSGAIEFWKDLTPTRAIAFGMATPGTSITDDFVISTWTGSLWYERFRLQTSSGNIGIGTTLPSAILHILGTTEQLRIGYNASNAVKFTVNSSNALTITPITNSTSGFVFTNAAGNTLFKIDTTNKFTNIPQGQYFHIGNRSYSTISGYGIPLWFDSNYSYSSPPAGGANIFGCFSSDTSAPLGMVIKHIKEGTSVYMALVGTYLGSSSAPIAINGDYGSQGAGVIIGIGGVPANSRGLDVYGGLTIGSGYVKSYAAPSNGAIIQGKLGVSTTSPSYQCHIVGTFGFNPGASVTPANNGDVVIELTNNTTLTFRAKGSDGVVRSASLTLS